MDLLGVLLLVLVVVICFWLVQQWENKQRRLPPGPFRWPLIGTLVPILRVDPKYPFIAFTKLAQKYGKVAFYRMGIVNAAVITGYEEIKAMSTSDDWLLRSVDRSTLQRTFGKPIGIIFAGMSGWKTTRRFTVRHLRDYGFGRKLTMEGLIIQELEDVSMTIDKAIKNDEGVLDPTFLFSVATVNIVWALASGTRFEHDDVKSMKLVQYLADFTKALLNGGLGTLYPFLIDWVPSLTEYEPQRKANSNFRQYTKELLAEHRQLNYKDDPQSFIDIFLQNIEKAKEQNADDPESIFTDENLISILYDLFWAGSDTSSSTIKFALLYLTSHLDVQEKMRMEMDTVLGKGQLPTLADKERLPYVRATLLEVHRRSFLVPLVFRQAPEDLQFEGYVIPKDTKVFLNYYSVMMDKKFYGDPENFRPERFLNGRQEIVNSERVLPFGMGKRSCIGESVAEASIFLMVTHLIQKYNFERVPGDQLPAIPDPFPGVILSPTPYKLIVRSRI